MKETVWKEFTNDALCVIQVFASSTDYSSRILLYLRKDTAGGKSTKGESVAAGSESLEWLPFSGT